MLQLITIFICVLCSCLVEAEISSNICVAYCNGMDNGNYPSCKSCSLYVTCINGYFNEHPCSDGLFWDNDLKACHKQSNTCPACLYIADENECREEECFWSDGSCQVCEDLRPGCEGDVEKGMCAGASSAKW